jgi:hypothetical protein
MYKRFWEPNGIEKLHDPLQSLREDRKSRSFLFPLLLDLRFFLLDDC